ncbi:MAG: D-alanyl-D-alanine carboxypeptidase [Lachnospiraceae bacterium]|nr:D-alanyl-D-alanine carboxypeptidase [Lachnospiraceae bacterium]
MTDVITIPGYYRRGLSIILVLCLVLFPILPPIYARGESIPVLSDTQNPVVTENIDAEETMASADMDITAKAAVLIDNHTGRILYEKNKDKELVPASITKIMTLLLIFEAIEQGNCKLEDIVTTSEYAASMGGSQVFLEPGENQTVETMIKCISIASANDAAVAMAEHIAGSEGAFVKRMNKKAKELGMEHTQFKNCNGLDDSIKSGHYSSAYDVALMSKELMSKYPDISKYSTVWMDTIIHKTKKGEKEFGLTNTNKLIRTYNGITGLKTGSTSKAKYCLSATATRDGVNLTAVIMAAPDHKVRFSQAAALLDYGFANCSSYEEKSEDIPVKSQKIAGGVSETITPRIEKSFQYVLCGEEQGITPKRKITYKKNLTAPIKEGDQIGTVTYYLNDKEIGSLPIVAAETVKKAHYPDIFLKVLRNLLACKE